MLSSLSRCLREVNGKALVDSLGGEGEQALLAQRCGWRVAPNPSPPDTTPRTLRGFRGDRCLKEVIEGQRDNWVRFAIRAPFADGCIRLQSR